MARVSVALTAELDALLREAVASGAYPSGGAVIREALDEWRLRRAQPEASAELRRLWDEGLESGPGRFADMNAIKAEARRRAGLL